MRTIDIDCLNEERGLDTRGFAVIHGGVSNVVYGDAHVDNVSAAIDPEVWRQINDVTDGEPASN
jgi:prepilin-type processing-associated H-X9-DG protein